LFTFCDIFCVLTGGDGIEEGTKVDAEGLKLKGFAVADSLDMECI